MEFIVKLKTNDFFRIFRNRVSASFEVYTEDGCKKNVIFKETIDTLERIEKFATEIKDGVWEEGVLKHQLGIEKNPQKMQYICQCLNDYRICKALFVFPENFVNHSFKTIYKHYEKFDLELKLVNLQVSHQNTAENLKHEYQKASFIYHGELKTIQWSPESLPLDRILRLIKSTRLTIDRDREAYVNVRKSAVQKINELNQIFDQLLVNHSSLYVFALDIHLSNFLERRSIKNGENTVDIQFNEINQIRLKIQQLSDCLASCTKIENDSTETGLNLHCILFLKPNKNNSEQDIMTLLEKRIQSVLEDSQNVEIRNWNEVIRRNYSKDAVGLIRLSQTVSISEFKYWILGYFVHIDLYLKAILPKFLQNNLQINDVKVNSSFNSQDVEYMKSQAEFKKNLIRDLKRAQKANKKLDSTFKIINEPFLKNFNSKMIWDTKHLPQLSQEYINATKHYFREMKIDEQEVEILIKIEIFIQTLFQSKCVAFELSVSPESLVPVNKNILKNAVTRIGLQFIAMGEDTHDFKTTFHIHQPLVYLNSLARSVIAFQIVNEVLPPNNFVQLINEHIQGLRHEFSRKLIEFGNKSIDKYRAYKYKQYKDRLGIVSDLIKQLFKQDCLIYKVSFEAEPTNQAQLSKLFTNFLHHAERSKPLYWKIGHFGLWRENKEGHPYAEVFFVFDKRAFGDIHSTVDKINNQWVGFMKKKYHHPSDSHGKQLKLEKCQVRGKPIMIKNLEYALDHLLIETSNKKRKLDFLDQVIPIFLISDIFEANPKQNYPKALIKSSMVTATSKQNKVKKAVRKTHVADETI